MFIWGINDVDVIVGEVIVEDGVVIGLKEEVLKVGILKEGGLNLKLGLFFFLLFIEGFELKLELDLVFLIFSFVVVEILVVVLDVVELIVELDKVGNEIVVFLFDEFVLFICFLKDMDLDVFEVLVGFVNDGVVVNEKEGVGLEGLLLVNLKMFFDEVFDESDLVE